jgi:small subunit ribosomal protein S14
MAKVSSIMKNNKRKKLAKSLSNKRNIMKAKIYDKTLSLEKRFLIITALAALPRNSAATRIRNRCALTGRSRGYMRKFDLSRNMLRDYAGKGAIPGLIKASW